VAGLLPESEFPFSGDKMDFQKKNAPFTICASDLTFAQFKMLRLVVCLGGKAANTLKPLGYSLDASEAVKTR